MINKEIPFRPKLEGEFRTKFYNAASEISEKTSIKDIIAIADCEISWVENDCHYNMVNSCGNYPWTNYVVSY